MAQQNVADESTEPEHTDAEIEAAIDALLDLCDGDRTLDWNVDSVSAPQLDNPWTDDDATVDVFMDELGSGATKATIIQKVITSDVPLMLSNTCDGHEHISFKVVN